jgi:hypothetical protein
MKIKTSLLVFWKIETLKMGSNGRWLRATVQHEEEEGLLGGIYRRKSTSGLLKKPPV